MNDGLIVSLPFCENCHSFLDLGLGLFFEVVLLSYGYAKISLQIHLQGMGSKRTFTRTGKRRKPIESNKNA
ncbi:hypothetical protein HanHA300_Chr13g0493021 [Helianthus annuus]|nr:hypothetical protein HanHA300_Chr13g0493021 [Helianthus annuus]KAJ0498660.1 hypothetical protein HanHA89_Chr13g0525151 [Helianthus annuus]KAJ0664673.1 hypothetical protein HanLR1_Chr13g0495141 [Helianthus annuus]